MNNKRPKKSLVTICTVAALFFVIPAHASYAQFSDIEGHDYAEAIEYLETENIMEGYADGTARPDTNINRAEFLKILMEMEDIPTAEKGNFSDVKDKDWFAPYIYGAAEAGLVNGYADGSFKPEQNINFAEASKMIAIAIGFEVLDRPDDIWYQQYVLRLSRRAAIPLSISSFDKLVTRGETAEMIWRMNVDYSGESYRTYGDIVKDEHEAAYRLDPVGFAQKLVQENKVSLDPKYHLDWLGDDVRNEMQAIAEYSALYEDEYIPHLACKNIYKGILNFNIPYQINFVVKEFDKDTFVAVPNGQFQDENCSKVFKDKNGVYFYHISGENVLNIATNISDVANFEAIEGLDLWYRDGKKVYALVDGELRPIDIGNIDISDFHEFLYTPDQELVAELNESSIIHSCYGDDYCRNKIIIFNPDDILVRDGDVYFFDKHELTFRPEVDSATLEYITIPDVWNSFVVFLRDRNVIYRMKNYKLESLTYLDRDTFEVKNATKDMVMGQDKDIIHVELKDGDYQIFIKDYEKIDTPVLEIPMGIGFSDEGGNRNYYSHDTENVYRIFDRKQIVQSIVTEESIPVLLKNMDVDTFDVNIIRSPEFVYGKSSGRFWFYKENTKEEVFRDDVDPDSLEFISELKFKHELEDFDNKTRFHYSDTDLCALFVKTLDSDGEFFPGSKYTLEIYPDHSCATVENNFVNVHYKYSSGFLFKDKNSVFMYDDLESEIMLVEDVDVDTLVKLGDIYFENPVFKDSNAVYLFKNNKLNKIAGIDSETVKFMYKYENHYLQDSEGLWIYDWELRSFTQTDEEINFK